MSKVAGFKCFNITDFDTSKLKSRVNKVKGIKDTKIQGNNITVVYNNNILRREDIERTLKSYNLKLSIRKTIFNLKMAIVSIITILLVICISLFTSILSFIENIAVLYEGISIFSIFLIALLSSMHCACVCGGICAYQNNILMYNAGRIVAYTLLGGISAFVGIALDLQIRHLVGVLILVCGLLRLGIIDVNMLNIPKQREKGVSSGVAGLLTAVIPCSSLLGIQVVAMSSGSVTTGMLIGFIFCLGTLPIMFVIHFCKKVLYKYKLNIIASVFIIICGVLMFMSGLVISGFLVSETSVAYEADTSSIKDGIQTVTTELQQSYKDIVVTHGIPVKWTIKVENLTACNSVFICEELGLYVTLKKGDNVIEFIPQEEGYYEYRCSMNMLAATIIVI
ncbi:MAG: sulfite exporter TauE/SafE family protein [Endomicrobium sp.]|jgi:sulfite exporter TauE/SafE|nr:sulfite exporter TauE/SafE family protein [Endomicrobium sp.]